MEAQLRRTPEEKNRRDDAIYCIRCLSCHHLSKEHLGCLTICLTLFSNNFPVQSKFYHLFLSRA